MSRIAEAPEVRLGSILSVGAAPQSCPWWGRKVDLLSTNGGLTDIAAMSAVGKGPKGNNRPIAGIKRDRFERMPMGQLGDQASSRRVSFGRERAVPIWALLFSAL